MSFNRRQFLKTSAASLAALTASRFASPAILRAQGANSKLQVAVVGIAGRGAGNISELLGGSKDLVEIAALCDVDDNNLAAQGDKFPNAKRFFDYRAMFDEMKSLDAVLVSTPDHTHSVVAMAAMKRGMPCFCEKPLAHDVAEIRDMQKIAKEKNLATQMGTVIHATSNYRRVVELVQAGSIGEVKEVHVWCAKGWGGYPEPDMNAKFVGWHCLAVDDKRFEPPALSRFAGGGALQLIPHMHAGRLRRLEHLLWCKLRAPAGILLRSPAAFLAFNRLGIGRLLLIAEPLRRRGRPAP